MFNHFKQHISENFPFINQKKILVATSGGVDSVVLVHLLHSLDYKIALAHCNFKLRGKESDLDAELVVNLGNELNCETFVQTFNTADYAEENKVSIQVAARELRYKWFSDIVNENDIDYIATAHHADDNLETFLINLSRGTGLDGLTGIPEKNGKIIRPLLPFTKSDIIEYAQSNSLKWREDQTNSETKYVRNKVRHHIIPSLKELNPSLLDNFSKTVNFLKQSRVIIDEKIEEVLEEIQTKEGDILKFNIEKMLKLKNQKAFLFEVFKRYNFTEWDNVFELIKAQSGKIIYSKSHVLLKDRDYLLLKELKKEDDNISKFYIEEDVEEINNPIKLSIKNTDKKRTVSKNYVLVNKNLVTFPIILRKWEEGDFFYPTGMTGKKKVSKFFKDEKFSKFKKDKTWLLCNANNDIIWIVGTRQDRRFSIDSSAENILQISI
ncbi:tRNA lysidine(34) synthetase TilS [Tenacibaculum sp. MEBiC06402]|uniref:tRNA lysidine(34) synthetase TilS n=1 Tax=unclassified Tenacibaculum TaxID=2635139 RepID=UPI003B9D6C8D